MSNVYLMDDRDLLRTHCILEKLITERESMIVANKEKEYSNLPPIYSEEYFIGVAKDIEALKLSLDR